MARPTWTVRLGTTRLPIWITRPVRRAARRTLILATGAGTGATHPWLTAQARALAERGLTVVRFDFLYRAAGRRAPDRLPALMKAYRAVLDRVRADGVRPGALWLGGKSMGARVASHVAADGARCAGLVCYGYPLAPRGTPAPERTAHWPDVSAPALFLTGTRDRLCPLADLARALPRWGGDVAEHHVHEADHGFAVLKRTGRCPAEVHAELATAVADWVRGGARRRGRTA